MCYISVGGYFVRTAIHIALTYAYHIFSIQKEDILPASKTKVELLRLALMMFYFPWHSYRQKLQIQSKAKKNFKEAQKQNSDRSSHVKRPTCYGERVTTFAISIKMVGLGLVGQIVGKPFVNQKFSMSHAYTVFFWK